jgi:hypothetical protein
MRAGKTRPYVALFIQMMIRMITILKALDRSDYGIASVAAAYGWATSHLMVFWLALPSWAQAAIQGMITILFGLGALTAQYFWRRYLRRRWPDQKPESESGGDQKPESESGG